MCKLLPVLLVAFATCVHDAHAQSYLHVQEATLENGAVGVPLVDSIYFSLSHPLPFNSLFTRKFHWEPRRMAFRRYIFLDADRQYPRFTIVHQPSTDYAVYVFGVEAENGLTMERPFTLNYTTASTFGTHQLTGAVSVGERRAPSASVQAATLARMIAEAHPDETSYMQPRHRTSQAVQQDVHAHAEASNVPPAPRRAAAPPPDDAAPVLRRTVVLLLDAFAIDDDVWSVRAASALAEDGSFTFDYVRPGTYYPVAINFADQAGTVLGAYGFYDPDDDYVPDAVTVADRVSGVDLSLFSYQARPAIEWIHLASERATRDTADQRLVRIHAPSVRTDGAAFSWTYDYYSPSLDRVTRVTVTPLTVRDETVSPDAHHATQAALPADPVDTDAALAAAETNGGAAFVEQYGADSVTVAVEGGDLPMNPRPTTGPFWRVRYVKDSFGNPDARTDTLDIFVDIQSGEVVEAHPVAGETETALPGTMHLEGNRPNPFRHATEVAFSLPHPGEVHLEVFDLLGRRAAVLHDRRLEAGTHTVTWTPAPHLPAGVYLLRLAHDGQAQTRLLHLVR